MIALFLALAAAAERRAPPPPPPPAAIDGLPIAGLAPQALPARGCSAYLFSAGQTRALAVVVASDPAALRIALDGKVADYPRVAQRGTGDYGFASVTDYQLGEVTLSLDMTVVRRADVTDGALVPSATLRIDRTGKDGIVLPLAGLIGCAKEGASG
ncbi:MULTISPECIES: hypothetical protein [Sphingomonas]|uniref:Uncharacterized protein n=1 Tax=Sphingomonas lycopersici TaxID=2951807 RepID=A0AA42CQU5_9SPHN|nr:MULTISPECIES: hypothetical protein [Sphingomonas]MCW6529845.1 hypothetical protein [Sphingomonas lycopersici]MCW6535352.1 hypothetical protein [Sphingomonas lycopersici]OJU17406.1 MAG: hypothetical protein BGN95_19485 [Sphingomonas sp. 66-10]